MRKIFVLFFAIATIVSCAGPIDPPVTPLPAVSPVPSPEPSGEPSPDPSSSPEPQPIPIPSADPIPEPSPTPLPSPVMTPPVPIGWDENITKAEYIRLPGAVVHRSLSRGLAGAFTDPDESKCTTPGSLYMFYDDNSIVEYAAADGKYDLLKRCGRLDTEARNHDHPEAPWDYIAIDPPLPPPPVIVNPVVPMGQMWYLNADGTPYLKLTAENKSDWDLWHANNYRIPQIDIDCKDKDDPANAPHRYVFGPDPTF